MKRKQQQKLGRTAFDLIEEATHLLRTAPAATLAPYFLGAVPFVLGLLFFWADMSRSPLAAQHLASGSLALGALFLWMKSCQAVFARRIRAQAAGKPLPPLTLRRCARIFFKQAIIQPLGLFILPLALLALLPFPWVYAFYQNATALDDGAETGTGGLIKKARRQAVLWPRQNCIMLLLMLGGFATCVFLNWLVVCLTVPELGKMLFGIESNFTRSPLALLNTTFFTAMAGLTYLCVDPILKSIYVLRCFYGESLESGEDLKAELKPFVNAAAKIAAAIAVFFMIWSAGPARAQSTNAAGRPAVSQAISPPDLDKAINQTIHERKFVWRMPREQALQQDAQKGIFARFFDKVGTLIREWVRAAMDWLEKILQKLLRALFPRHSGSASTGYGWIMSLQLLLYGLVAAVIAALLILLFRVWRNYQTPPAPVASEAIRPVPDLADENVRADQLPEDGWTKLARELLERGEFRLAMRAFYLAALAHLATRNLISIARFKSNRDYERELCRRAHAIPDLLAVFGDNVSAFERIWYGLHQASRDTVDQFAANLERLKDGG
jgi:hypothetical protein